MGTLATTMNSTSLAGIAGLVILLVASGCASPGQEPETPSGPNDNFSGTVGGSQRSTEEFNVPAGTDLLTIAASYSVGGSARFELYDPTGKLQKTQSVSGGAAANDDSWFRMPDPPGGRWTLQLDLSSGVVYNFDVYYVGSAPAEQPQGDAQSNAATPAVSNPGTWVAVAGGVGVGALAIALVATEFGRYKALTGIAALGLFSRLEKDEVLAHEKREQVYQFIKDNPGPSFSDLLRELELSNGTLVHHLRILEAQEFIKPHRDGFRTRFYLRGPKVTPTAYVTRTQQQILDAIGAQPGVTQKELTNILRIPREAVSYHTKRLAAQGQLQVRQEGKWRRYWLVGGTSAGNQNPVAAQPA